MSSSLLSRLRDVHRLERGYPIIHGGLLPPYINRNRDMDFGGHAVYHNHNISLLNRPIKRTGLTNWAL